MLIKKITPSLFLACTLMASGNILAEPAVQLSHKYIESTESGFFQTSYQMSVTNAGTIDMGSIRLIPTNNDLYNEYEAAFAANVVTIDALNMGESITVQWNPNTIAPIETLIQDAQIYFAVEAIDTAGNAITFPAISIASEE